MTTDPSVEDYVARDWEEVRTYDCCIRAALADRSHGLPFDDTFSSNDERTVHLMRLVRSARLTGDRKYVDLLLDWYSDPRFIEWPRLQMTLVVSLVFATFYRTAMELFERILGSPAKEYVVRGMCDAQVMFLSYGMFEPFFQGERAVRFRSLLNSEKPWISVDQFYREVREGFLAELHERQARAEGGWERIECRAAELPKEVLFTAGQVFDARLLIEDIVRRANREIVLIDPYTGIDAISVLSSKGQAVSARVLTKSVSQSLRSAGLAFSRQYGGLSIRTSDAFHDRFVIIDGVDFYHVGASIEHLGRRTVMLSRIEEPTVRTKLWSQYVAAWEAAADPLQSVSSREHR